MGKLKTTQISEAQKITISILNQTSEIDSSSDLKKQLIEKEILLSLSSDIAATRTREDLVNIIQNKLKGLLNVNDFRICLVDLERNLSIPFLILVEGQRKAHTGFQSMLTESFPLNDGIFDQIIENKLPIVSDLEQKSKNKHVPAYVNFLYQTGLEELISLPLYNENKIVGVFCVASENKGTFQGPGINFLNSVSTQIAIAVANIIDHEAIEQREGEKEILLSLSNEISSIREKEDLLPILQGVLNKVSFYNDVTIAVINPDKKTFSGFLLDPEKERTKHPDYYGMSIAKPLFPDGVFEVALHSKKPVIYDIKEVMKRPTVPGYISFIHEVGVTDMVGIALRDRNKEIGVLFLFSSERKEFTDLQLTLVQGISNQLGIVVANLLANEDIRKREYEKSILLSFSNDIATVRDRNGLFNVLSNRLKELFLLKSFVVAIINEDEKTQNAFLMDLEEKVTKHPDFEKISSKKFSIEDGVFDIILGSENPVVFVIDELLERSSVPEYIQFCKKTGIDQIVGVALKVGEDNIGCLWLLFENAQTVNYLPDILLKGVCSQVAMALSNILSNEKIAIQLDEINHYKKQLEEENLYLQEQINTVYNYSEIIGSGTEMQKVFHLLSQVAFANSSVLILGETGTGKELLARAIHTASPRKDKLMVKVNCAALPPNLIESELFGHEKGSFTGAIERRVGKFELANGSTLFLDEIGDLPLELQAKLLRALQEKEIERVGGKTTIKTDVRIIAATSRNLQKEVLEGRFRSDLFYRLNVFPITMPPLRNRKEDIPVLVSHFITKYARHTGKNVNNISHKSLQDLMTYNWPGNVRELEHVIERSVLLTNSNTIREIHLPIIDRQEMAEVIMEEEFYTKTIEENERDHILTVLKKCNGKIFGKGGAAELLGVHVSTLNSKIKKLGIKKENPEFKK